MTESVKRRHESGAAKRKKQEEKKKKNDLIICQTSKIWDLGFSRMSRQISVSDVVVDVPSGTNEESGTSRIVSFPMNERQNLLMVNDIELQS